MQLGNHFNPRAETLQRFRDGVVEIIFCVDVFNEGVDVPEIDTILMLRPTESRIIWLQQLGRGLRKCADKVVSVIDYIGNHRSFLVKVQSLLGVGEKHSEITAALEKAYRKELELPLGCDVTYALETRDILGTLLDRYRDASWEDLGAIPVSRRALTIDSERRVNTKDRDLAGFFIQHAVMHGRRPFAVEAYYAGFTFGMENWFEILSGSPLIDPFELQEIRSNREFLLVLSKTAMNKSYKMLVLLAMLQVSTIPGEVKLDDLLQPFRQLALRSVRLSADLGAALQSPRLLRARLQKAPMTFLTRGNEAKFFAFEDGVFRTTPAVTVTDPQVMQELVREVCEWKLAIFLDSKRAEINRAKTKARGECSEA